MPKNPNQSKEAFEESPLIDRRTAITGIFSIFCICMGFVENCSSCSGEKIVEVDEEAEERERHMEKVKSFLGTWRHKDGETVVIYKTNNANAAEKIKLSDGKIAKLVLPVKLDTRPNRLIMITSGGIYQVDGKYSLIEYCTLHKENVLVALKRPGENLRIGLSGKYRNTNHALQANHERGDDRYKPVMWRTYYPVN